MPDGSLTINTQTLQAALLGITGLKGEEPAGDNAGTMFSGAASAASTSLGGQIGQLEDTLAGPPAESGQYS